ncbi:peptidoglycan-binding protein [Streptomyces sp. NPDC015131]|uniref:peptidoglycan-binding protein n=1 Tax=Streptomyces sp. NPDC015131 TaxID=3364941 RepID=UPI0036F6B7F0
MPLSGRQLTPAQVARLCYKHGIDPDAGKGVPMVTAIAVCFAESSYFTGAWNFTTDTGDKSYGLWQINMLGAMGPERRAKYGLKNNEALYDPDTNCKVMVDMSKKGTDFRPWGAYTSGSYRGAWSDGVAGRAALLKQLGRPVTKVPIPPEKPVPLAKRSWISYRQVRAAAESKTGVVKVGSDSSRDDVANYQRGVWSLIPGIDFMYTPGVYDDKTKKATAMFQRAQGWPGSGIVGPQTMKLVEAKSQLFRVRDW